MAIHYVLLIPPVRHLRGGYGHRQYTDPLRGWRSG